MIKRRRFIAGIGAAAAWPLAARAQQAVPVVGFLHEGFADGYARELNAFRQGLREAGYVEGQNVAIEYRWAEDYFDRLAALASDLVGHHAALIVSVPLLPQSLMW